jgi:hypothetical protein
MAASAIKTGPVALMPGWQEITTPTKPMNTANQWLAPTEWEFSTNDGRGR